MQNDPHGLPVPSAMLAEHHAPIIDMLSDTLITPDQLAKRWGHGTDVLSNLRRARRGVPWIKLPTGRIRYRLSDIIRAEATGRAGPVTVDVVRFALMGLAGISPQLRETIARRIESIIASEPRG